jgi:lipoprotein-anchoring transpeptidase ErfK/SrfK
LIFITTHRFLNLCLLTFIGLSLFSLVMADEPEQAWQLVRQKLISLYPNLEAMDGSVVSISQQRLYLVESGNRVAEYVISSSRYGKGSESGSLKTPLGIHRIQKKIGAEAPSGTIFKSRVNTGEIAEIVSEARRTDDDFVTTRILWLHGQEPGLNQGESIDSFKRYIYIHGTHEEGLLGQPASKGCIRMYNEDVITVFDQLPEQTLVVILP